MEAQPFAASALGTVQQFNSSRWRWDSEPLNQELKE
jgi:hypothetical protein